MDIYQKALKNPDPPKKPASTTTTPPSSTSTDYNTRLPPMNHNNNNVDSMNYNYSHDNGLFTGSTTTTTNISNENSNNNSSTNSPNSRPSSTNTNTNAHTSEEIKNNVIRKKKNSRRKHRNSHLGCGTCKKRRIKCDETLPACLNCLKGKLHCAYLNLDNNARNALRVAQYNQTIRQEKLDANSSSSTTANINNNTKLIDPSKDNILVQQQQPVGIVQSLAHGTSIVPPHHQDSCCYWISKRPNDGYWSALIQWQLLFYQIIKLLLLQYHNSCRLVCQYHHLLIQYLHQGFKLIHPPQLLLII